MTAAPVFGSIIPARAALEKLAAGGKIDKIDKEVEKGQVVYDVEATVNSKHVEYTIATDGAVVGTEASIEYSELPDAVRAAAEMYFGSATGLNPVKVVEDGQTTYEIEGAKNGKKVAVTFDLAGNSWGKRSNRGQRNSSMVGGFGNAESRSQTESYSGSIELAIDVASRAHCADSVYCIISA